MFAREKLLSAAVMIWAVPTLTRDELYALVWSEPIQHLAPRYGLSDRGLGKLCERHNIPVPPRGWWAKKAAGKRVRQELLPPLAPGQSPTIVIEGQKDAKSAEPLETSPVPPEIAFEREPENVLAVDEKIRITHPLVRDAAKELRSRPADHDEIVHTPRGCVDVRVSKESVTRAMRILHALFVGLERRRYPVSIKDGKTFITVLGEPFRIFLKEHLKQTLRELTPDEHRRRREGHEVIPYVRRPNGELGLNVPDSYPQMHTRDRKKRRLEDSLNLFVEGLIERAFAEKARRAAWELEKERQREEQRKRKEAENRQRENEQAIARFDFLAETWAKTEQRRAFLAGLREVCGPVEDGSELARWLADAEHWTKVSDPLNAFREPRKTLKLYYVAYEYQLAEVRREGFRDPDPSSVYGREKPPPSGIKVIDCCPGSGSAFLEVELHEGVVLPFEVTTPGYVPRTFYVPARVLNGVMDLARRVSGESHD